MSPFVQPSMMSATISAPFPTVVTIVCPSPANPPGSLPILSEIMASAGATAIVI